MKHILPARSLFLSLIAGLFLNASTGCLIDGVGQNEQHSTWDQANAPETFGVKSLKIADLQQEDALKGYLNEKPWADTYWPLDKKGMSQR